MVDKSDIDLLERNGLSGLVDIVLNKLKKGYFKEELGVSLALNIEEDKEGYEAWLIRAKQGFKEIISRTYLGRVRTYAF